MQLVDRNGVFKNWNTLKHEYDLQNNLYFYWMLLINAIPSNWKNLSKIAISKRLTTQHHFIRNSRVLTVQKVGGAILDTYNNN